MARRKRKSIQKKDASELAVPIGLFIVGIGLIVGQIVGGVLIGLGTVFLLLIIIIKLIKKK